MKPRLVAFSAKDGGQDSPPRLRALQGDKGAVVGADADGRCSPAALADQLERSPTPLCAAFTTM